MPPFQRRLVDVGRMLLQPADLLAGYRAADLPPDLVAGLTVALVILPQAIAYALVAGLPPQMGLYAAIAGSIAGALWGSSNHLQTGPTNTSSLLVLSALVAVAAPGSPEYIAAAGLLTLMVGLIRVAMGLGRLGVLVNFVSDSVIVGYTAGAGILIFVDQLRPLLRLDAPATRAFPETLAGVVRQLPGTHLPSLLIGLSAIGLIVLVRLLNRRLPGPLLALVVTAAVSGAFSLGAKGLKMVGQLPRGLPPLAALPILNLDLIGQLATGALAVAAIGLVEAVSIARTIASQTGQHLDSNQEFIGQGMANLASGIFSGFACSGSFTRSAINRQAGARTPMASVFAGLFVLIALLALGPLAARIPLSAVAGVLIVIAFGLIDRKEIARIWSGAPGDRAIMLVTVAGTLLLPLYIAVLSGILMSLAYYLLRTSTPRVRPVLPNGTFAHFAYQPGRPACPQLGVVEILGDLYFGAVHHIEECIQGNRNTNPEQRFLLLRMHGVGNCDISAVHALEGIVRGYRERYGDVFLSRVRAPVLEFMRGTGFYDILGANHFLDQDDAIAHLFYRVLDPAICIYECPVKVFKECQNLPKAVEPAHVSWEADLPLGRVPTVSPKELWEIVRRENRTVVIDVREPREFKRGHIPGALSIPLPLLLADAGQIPGDRPVVLVCQGGRRSTRAAAWLGKLGFKEVLVLAGGMASWQRGALLQAVDEIG